MRLSCALVSYFPRTRQSVVLASSSVLSKVERCVVILVGLADLLNVFSKASPLVCLRFDFSSIPFGVAFAGGGGRIAG